MRPKRTIEDVVYEAVLKEIHPKRDIALKLVAMGLFSPRKKPWLTFGQCRAYARSTGKRCCRKCLPCGVCSGHGGLSTGPRTKAGLKATADAARTLMTKRWDIYRAGRGPRPNAPRGKT
jgi:hypothetical protein